MNCRGVSRRLSAYIDGELSPGIRGSVEDHIKNCVGCSRKLAELRAISETARNLPPLRVSEGFREKIVESLAARRERAAILLGYRARVAFAGLAFVTAAAAVFFIAGPVPENISPRSSSASLTTEPAGEVYGPMDFVNDPTIKIKAFPVPEGARSIELTKNDSLLLADSASKIDDFILPLVEEKKENVNIKF